MQMWINLQPKQKYQEIIDKFIKEEPKIKLPSKEDLPDDIDDLREY